MKPHFLVRSGWQTVNIGDMAHTPGLFALLEKHFPEAKITLLPTVLSAEVEAMILKRFPKVKVVRTQAEVDRAFDACDFFLHGSGGALVGWRDVLRWREQTGKPFGAYGIGFPFDPAIHGGRHVGSADSPDFSRLLSDAKFVYFRDSVSLRWAKELGCTSPVMEFGPDAVFATDLRNDAPADEFLKKNHLEEGKFLCCIPRLRHTPYWVMKEGYPVNPERQARNEAMKEHDNAPLREAILRIVQETDYKILLCPEDSSQMAVGEEMVLRKLPGEAAKRVVWRKDFWLTDEALSTFVRSAGLFGNEMHSPIMCIGNGIPAIVCRWAEQSMKGIMWRDIGLSDWLFDFDIETEVQAMPEAVLNMAKNPGESAKKVEQARKRVEQLQSGAMAVLRESLG